MTTFLHQTQSYWNAGGPLLIPLAVVCVGIWGYFLRSRDRLRMVSREARDLETTVARDGLEGLPEAGTAGALLARVAADIRGGAPPRIAFQVRGGECMEALRRDVVVLGALTAVAPLLGLLGTVRGMIETFAAVSSIGGNTGVEVADGISQALITTQFGLVVAVPGVFGVSRLRALSREVEARMGALRAAALAKLEAPAREAAA